MSSIFQVEQEEAAEWRAMEEDSKDVKSQEILDIVPPEDSGKPADTVLPTSDAKPTRRPTSDVSKTKHYCLRCEHLRVMRAGDV